MNKPVKIWFDGGARPNPGPIETAVTMSGQTHIRYGLPPGGNEEAEWIALLHAMELAGAARLDDIVLIGDALAVIGQALGKQRGRSPWIERYREAARGFTRVRLRHVRRSHNLAGIALDKARFGA